MMKDVVCMVETPKNSNAKYNYDPGLGGLVLAKYLPLGFVFPYDFGFIPGTMGQDGDPLDVIVIAEQGSFPGSFLKCRVIGAIKAVQRERDGIIIENDRFLVVPENSKVFANLTRAVQLPDDILAELQYFFSCYSQIEGKDIEPLKVISAKDAVKAITTAKNNMEPIRKIEIFVPLSDDNGKPFPAYLYRNVKKKLIKDFGGVTAYTQAPAEGVWSDEDQKEIKDRIIVYEVMVAEIDRDYWASFRQHLEQQFDQKQLIIRQSTVGLL